MSTVQGKRTRHDSKGNKQSLNKENNLDKPQSRCPDCNEVVTQISYYAIYARTGMT